jgi:NADH dehydrogenase
MPNSQTPIDLTDAAAAGPGTRHEPHRIAIVGGGAAGLELVTRLDDTMGRRRTAEITLVDNQRTHLWTPLLHAVADGRLEPGEHELN